MNNIKSPNRSWSIRLNVFCDTCKTCAWCRNTQQTLTTRSAYWFTQELHSDRLQCEMNQDISIELAVMFQCVNSMWYMQFYLLALKRPIMSIDVDFVLWPIYIFNRSIHTLIQNDLSNSRTMLCVRFVASYWPHSIKHYTLIVQCDYNVMTCGYLNHSLWSIRKRN